MFNNNKNKYQIRTDIAFEELDFRRLEKSSDEIVEEHSVDGLMVRKTYVGQRVADEINKKSGMYYMIDSSSVEGIDSNEKIESALIYVLKDLLAFENIKPTDKGLIVGLGNINITPDSLGPLVCDNILVTRHLFDTEDKNLNGLSNISAISPGVMGQTGLETTDIIEAIVTKSDIDYIIVIDSLASRSVKRINKTIQVTNAGISPGSGVGSKRKEISKNTLKIPVIAIGVPTVVDSITIVSDTMDKVAKHFIKDDHPFKHMDSLNDRERRILFEEILGEHNFMVTPKDIDCEIEDLSRIISNALDRALHSVLTS